MDVNASKKRARRLSHTGILDFCGAVVGVKKPLPRRFLGESFVCAVNGTVKSLKRG